MTRDVAGRMIISCDRCSARLDLGAVTTQDPWRHSAPTGWLETGDNKHLCTLCSPGYTSSFIRRFG